MKVVYNLKLETYLSNSEFLPNLQLLEGIPNEEKSNKDFKSWLNETHDSDKARKSFLDKHHIPQDIDLGFTNFEEFFKRTNIIRNELRKLLI